MLNYRHNTRFEQQSLDNLQECQIAWLEMMQVAAGAVLDCARAACIGSGDWLYRRLDGANVAFDAHDRLVGIHLVAVRDLAAAHAAWLDTLERQMELNRQRLHELNGEVGHWIPRGAEFNFNANDIISSALNKSLEGFAEVAIDAARSLEHEAGQAAGDSESGDESPAATARRGSRRKAA